MQGQGLGCGPRAGAPRAADAAEAQDSGKAPEQGGRQALKAREDDQGPKVQGQPGDGGLEGPRNKAGSRESQRVTRAKDQGQLNGGLKGSPK